MPHATLKLVPGVDQNRTLALNEAAISQSQLIRFIPDKQGLGLVQKLGGWTKFFPTNIGSVARALWAWQDTNGTSLLGVGAEPRSAVLTAISDPGTGIEMSYSGAVQFVVGDTVTIEGVIPDAYNGSCILTSATYDPATQTGTVTCAESYVGPLTTAGVIFAGDGLSIISDGSRQIITPTAQDQSIAVLADTTAGSAQVTITAAGSAIYDGDAVYIKTQISIGGLVLFGVYPASFVDGSTQFIVTARDVLGNPHPATSTATGGAVPVFDFTSGEALVTVTLNDHGLYEGDEFPVLIPLTAAGVTLEGNYSVVSVVSSSQFTIRSHNSPTSTPVTGGSWLAGTATLAHDGAQSFAVGDTILVSGVNPSGYDDAAAVVTAVTPTTVSYAVASDPGAYVSGGTIFCSTTSLNGGDAFYEYFKTPSVLPTSTGYGIGGYGAGGYGTGVAPTVAASGNPIYADDWSLDNWGRIFVSCPTNGPIYTFDPLAGGTQASIIPQAPPINDGMFIAMPQRQIIAWGSTFNGVQDPLLIRWCEVDDYNQWIALPTNQAGSYRMPKGSKIIGGIQGPQQGIIWTDLACWAMQYVGPPYVYQLTEIGNGCGLIGRKAAASMSGVIYWMSQSQFFRLGGSGVEQIQCPIWDVIFQDIDMNAVDKIRVAPNSRFGEISWYYPTTGSGGEITKYVKHNIALGTWDFGSLSRTAWINQSVLGAPIGGAPVGTQNFIYQHETSPDADGQAMTSSFQTGYFVISDGEWKTFVDQVWPDMKWGYYGGAQDADLTITFYVADYPHQDPRVYGPYSFNNQTDFLTPRFRNRLVSIKLESSDIGSFWRIGATRYRYQPDGKF